MEELFVIRSHTASTRSGYEAYVRNQGVVAEQEQMFEVTVDNSEPDIAVEEGVTGEIEDAEMDIVDEIIDCGIFRFKKLIFRCVFRERDM